MGEDLAPVLRVGQQALIHFGARDSDSPRYSTAIRGWVNRSYLMADTPMAEGKAIPIVLGAPCVVRFLTDGAACGFSSSIVYAKRNETIFRIAWPADVEFVVVRKHERVNTTLHCSISGTSRGTQSAELVDLSAGGCRVHSSIAVETGSVIGLTIGLAAAKMLGPIKATVRSTLARGAGYSLGCQFDNLDETLRLEIENLVALRMKSLRAGSTGAPRALLVGYTPTLVDAVRQGLTATQWEVVSVTGAIDAFHNLRTSHVHLLIAEWGLPDLTGADICRVIRATKEFEQLPVILYGGAPSDETAARDAGATRFYTSDAKPGEIVQAAQALAVIPAAASTVEP